VRELKWPPPTTTTAAASPDAARVQAVTRSLQFVSTVSSASFPPPPPNCTALSLITSRLVNGNTVRNFPTHGQLSAAQGSATVSQL
jgi:hypothetical protein